MTWLTDWLDLTDWLTYGISNSSVIPWFDYTYMYLYHDTETNIYWQTCNSTNLCDLCIQDSKFQNISIGNFNTSWRFLFLKSNCLSLFELICNIVVFLRIYKSKKEFYFLKIKPIENGWNQMKPMIMTKYTNLYKF